MVKLNIHEIKAQFSKYIDMVEDGETVVVCKRNIPVAEIRPIAAAKLRKAPQLGWAEGLSKVPAGFKKWSQADLVQWEGDENDPLRKYAPKRKESKK